MEQRFMNLKNAKNSIGILAALAGLAFALVYVGLEILTENPEATHSISVWHFPLIWLLAGILSFLVIFAVRIVRSGKVRERSVAFSLSVAAAALLALFWLFPMLASLAQCFGGPGC
jgi:hypothetical protein